MKYLIIFSLFFSVFSNAQISGGISQTSDSDLSVDAKVINPSSAINDAEIQLEVVGGKEPYQYYWSNPDTGLNSNKSLKLTEGVKHRVRVVDANGSEVRKEVKIPAKSITENFNGFFAPLVDKFGQVLFWDPFAAMGLYDNHIRNDQGEIVLNPNGTPQRLEIPFIVIWLVFGAVFFTLRMGFINFRGFKHAIELVQGKFNEPNAPGAVTHFQALTTAVSGTVGLGNIAGVAVAIVVGGPGATFWLIVAGLLGMSTKFTECTLGVKYRDIMPDGKIYGGPMEYLSKGLKEKNMAGLGKILAVIFAILCVGASFGGGNMFQANQAFEQFSIQFGIPQQYGFYFGLIQMFMVAAVILGGIRYIAKVTEVLVPIMAGIYITACVIVIIFNFSHLDDAIHLIIDGAFHPDALKGGVVGVLIQGFRRAAFSNEAGVGSAAIAHSAAKTKHPVSEGFVALLEPFIDTVVVCTLTALVLIFSGNYEDVSGFGGAKLTSNAFGSVLSWFPYVLTIAIFLFAFSTMISWSYYGLKAWNYLFGKGKTQDIVYKCIFLIFVVIGASVSLGAVLEFSDMMILAMALPNIIGLLILSNDVAKDLKTYLTEKANGTLFRKPKKEKAK